MSEKSVIDIDVHDAAFQAFLKAFLEFSDSLSDIPRDWAKVDKAIGATAPKMRKVNGESEKSAKAVAKGIDQATKAQKGLEKATGRSAAAMSRLGKEAKQVGHVLKSIAGFAMKFSAIGLGLTGIGGAASLFGIMDLASSAMNRQKSARGMGMTIGQQTALKNYGSRLFNDPLSVAQQAAEAKSNPQAAIPFEMLGYSYSQVLRRSVPSLVFGAARREKALIGSNPQTAIMYSQNTALGAIASPSDLLRLQRTSNGAINAAQASYRAAVPKDEIARAAADRDALMIQQVRQSEWEVERSLIVALAQLSPEISKASKGLANFVSGLIDSKPVAHFISHLGTELQSLTAYLESKSFQSSLMKFGSGVELVAAEIWAVAEKLKWLLPAKTHIVTKASALSPVLGDIQKAGTWLTGNKNASFLVYEARRAEGYNSQEALMGRSAYLNQIGAPNAWKMAPFMSQIQLASKLTGAPASMIAGEAWAESGMNPAAISAGTYLGYGGVQRHAHGIMQFRRSTWRQFAHGLPYSDAMNPMDAFIVGGRLIAYNQLHHKTQRGMENAYSGLTGQALDEYTHNNKIGQAAYLAELKRTIASAVVEGMSKAQVHVHTPSVATGSHPALSHYAASR